MFSDFINLCALGLFSGSEWWPCWRRTRPRRERGLKGWSQRRWSQAWMALYALELCYGLATGPSVAHTHCRLKFSGSQGSLFTEMDNNRGALTLPAQNVARKHSWVFFFFIYIMILGYISFRSLFWKMLLPKDPRFLKRHSNKVVWMNACNG